MNFSTHNIKVKMGSFFKGCVAVLKKILIGIKNVFIGIKNALIGLVAVDEPRKLTKKEKLKIIREKQRKKMQRRGSRIIRYTALLALFLVAFFVAFDFAYKYTLKVEDNLKVLQSAGGMDVIEGKEFEIPYDSRTKDISKLLYNAGYIQSDLVFNILSKINGYDDLYQAGIHVISKKMNYTELMYTLCTAPKTVRVMIPEGYSIKQIAAKLQEYGVITEAEFYKAIEDETFESYEFLAALYDEENEHAYTELAKNKDYALEGYLFPDTYDFTVKSRPRDVLRKFLANFEVKFKNDYNEKMEKLGMTIDELLTLASIVEKESSITKDRRIIAGILYKRWKSTNDSMKYLQSCATIQYIYYRNTETVKKQIYYSDLEIDDVYNTYKYSGLPPGPICNPSKDAILAVLNMNLNNDYWYFCAMDEGSTYFSETYEEHMEAVRKYQYIAE